MTAPVDPGFLGYQPTIEPLKLTTGASFVQTIQPSGGVQFPANTAVKIVFTAPGGAVLDTWNATVTATAATWAVSNVTADAIPANSRYTLLVTYASAPPVTYAWYEGTVLRT
ncbi:hypothetical protein D7D52_25255 [Nocardia yunnanensis]|uniref:LtfC/p132/Gp6 beta-sandwich domain-containing protein n=1 Tax=Nocardia yunnanensis TaxID=2382165 RepID=A0A386ZHA7_9NOCA|nr:hypothetical protein [Nocardia yunnanensis]AYF76573.1 hypothetical protein D7D52_25255 [Nocardia yunnanensis]